MGILKAIILVKKKYSKIKLIVIGSGSEKKKLNNFVVKNNLEKNVVFPGYINQNKFMKNCKIFILNSFFEGLPNVLIEALNYKRPIISTNCLSGPIEILNNGKYGYLTEVNNHKKLALKIN